MLSEVVFASGWVARLHCKTLQDTSVLCRGLLCFGLYVTFPLVPVCGQIMSFVHKTNNGRAAMTFTEHNNSFQKNFLHFIAFILLYKKIFS